MTRTHVRPPATREAPAEPGPTRRARGGPGRRGTPAWHRWSALAFIAPLITYLVLFYGYPLYRNIDLSIHDYTPRAFVQGDAEFTGLANFADVVLSDAFGPAVWTTVVFTLASIAVQYAIGLALAVFFRTSFPLSPVLRGMFLVPWLLPMIVSASTWSWMLNSDHGIVNSVLSAFGIGQINWLTSPEWALVSVVVANIWLGIPFNLVILYSGLQNVPDELYEAAALDGAGPWKRFWHVTMPLLRPVSAITLLLGLVYTLKVVDVIWIMTVGGPGGSSTTLAIWSYRRAFGTGQPDFSEAAAVGNLLIVLALVFGVVHLYLQRREARR
ncbi:carbohydrate ABC transporter permease [Nocardiopsis aegyptia]|uniref:Multiple sugar transport system permease protein n=1 Tax=Nocardiopsis aegyptia TaxID=220378 RepID=A0A7Z0ESH2_9ACTN|nr:sugar ABC transporter permease [Nocardiopsis aegyptia]NYJ36520.1 multiple sugar transport system permease protein [Nocardiopsis aegyptia]